MHLYFITRGIKQQRDLFVNFMQTQMLPWRRKNLKTGKEEVCMVQGALRPVELWEYVFPEECLPDVLTMLEIHKMNHNWGLSEYKRKALRKMLGNGVMPIPKFEPVKNKRFIEKRGVAIYPIGIKKDKTMAVDKWGFEQEML